jgi:hypothetical protein
LELAAAELLTLGNDSPNGLVPHSGNTHGLLLALELLGCSGWLLGQGCEVPGCSNADTDFLPDGCSEETAFGIDATGSDADAGVGDLA